MYDATRRGVYSRISRLFPTRSRYQTTGRTGRAFTGSGNELMLEAWDTSNITRSKSSGWMEIPANAEHEDGRLKLACLLPLLIGAFDNQLNGHEEQARGRFPAGAAAYFNTSRPAPKLM